MKKTAVNNEHINYLRDFLGNEKVDTFFNVEKNPEKATNEEVKAWSIVKGCLEQMEKAGENQWWLSEDPRVLGYYQLNNSRLLIDWGKFVDSLTELLGRSVATHEFACQKAELEAEAERAFRGKRDSEEMRKETIKKSIDKLADLGKPVMVVVVD